MLHVKKTNKQKNCCNDKEQKVTVGMKEHRDKERERTQKLKQI